MGCSIAQTSGKTDIELKFSRWVTPQKFTPMFLLSLSSDLAANLYSDITWYYLPMGAVWSCRIRWWLRTKNVRNI